MMMGFAWKSKSFIISSSHHDGIRYHSGDGDGDGTTTSRRQHLDHDDLDLEQLPLMDDDDEDIADNDSFFNSDDDF